jgi:hypothetical protein
MFARPTVAATLTASALALASPAQAERPAPIVQEQALDALGPSSGRTLTFAQFDDMGGTRTLLDVGLELLDATTSVFHLQARNNTGVDNTVNVELVSVVRALAPSNLFTSVALSDPRSAGIGPLATYDFGELTDTRSSAANLVATPDPFYVPYIGQSTINIDVSNGAGLNMTCSVPDCYYTVTLSYDQWRVLARVRLTYSFADSPTSIGPQEIASRAFILGTPRPNPTNGISLTYFPVHAPRDARVELEVYDAQGRRIARSRSHGLRAGDSLLPWMPPRLASGVYNVRLRTSSGATSTTRWTIVR